MSLYDFIPSTMTGPTYAGPTMEPLVNPALQSPVPSLISGQGSGIPVSPEPDWKTKFLQSMVARYNMNNPENLNRVINASTGFIANMDTAQSYSWLSKLPEKMKGKVFVAYENSTKTDKVLHSYDAEDTARQIAANQATGLTPVGAFRVKGTVLEPISEKPVDSSILDWVAGELGKYSNPSR